MKPRSFLAVLGAVSGLLLGTVLVASPATAATLGGVSWSAKKGNAETLMSVTTERGCKDPAQRVSASLYGKGLPARGQVVVAPSTLLFSTSGPMTLPLSNAFVIYAERNSTGLDGTYQLKVKCTDRFGVRTLGEFGASMRWSTPGGSIKNIGRATFVATDTADVKSVPLPQPDEVLGDPAPASTGAPKSTPSPEPDAANDATRTAEPNAGSPQPAEVGPSAEPASSGAAVAGDATSGSGQSTSLLVLALAALVVALGGGAVWWLGRRRSDL